MMERSEDKIKQALAVGRLSVPDAYGMQHFIYAPCPADGQDSPIYRVDKKGEAVSKVTFRCPICGKEFDEPPEKMFLR